MSDVFVCHASEDRFIAEAAVAALEARGIRCWIAPRDVPPGSDYAGAILSGISTSRALLLIFSHWSNESPHVPREVERAVNRKMPIVPFRLDEVAPSGPLEYFISGAQWLDATSGRPDDHLPALVDAVRRLVSPATTPAPVAGEDFSREVREQLETLVLRYGTELAGDARRLQAVLRDMVGEHPAEISALVTAAEEGVPEMLLHSSDPGASATRERLAHRLKERRALGMDAAEWAVASWARALRIPPSPSQPPLDLGETKPASAAEPEETRPVEIDESLTPAVSSGQPAAPPVPPAKEVPRASAEPAQAAPSTPPQPRVAQSPPRPDGRPAWIYALLAVIGVALVVGAVVLFSGDEATGPAATDVTTTTGVTTSGLGTTPSTLTPTALSADSERIVARGQVRIGVRDNPLPPLTTFEADLSQEVVSRLFGDIAVELVPVAVHDRFAVLGAGDVDFLIRWTTHTTSREELASFTSPYFLDGLAFAFGSDRGISSISGLAGLTIGVLDGTSTELEVRQALEGNGVGATIVGFDDTDAVTNALAAGEVDAIGVFWAQALNYVETFGVDAFFYTPLEPLAVVVSLENPGLRDDLDRVLREMVADGTWRQLYELRFVEPPPWSEDEMLTFPPVDR